MKKTFTTFILKVNKTRQLCGLVVLFFLSLSFLSPQQLLAQQIESLSPACATVGEELHLTITGTNFRNGTSNNFVRVAGNGFATTDFTPTAASTNSIEVIIPASYLSQAGTINVVVHSRNGNSGNFSESNSLPLQVYSKLNPGQISGPLAVCINKTGETFSIPALEGANYYEWSVVSGDASIAAGGSTTTAQVNFGSTPGTVELAVRVFNQCDFPGLLTYHTVEVTLPPTVSVAAEDNTTTICEGESVVLTAAGADTYSWSPATTLSSAVGSSVIASPTVTTTYTLTGMRNGCSSTAEITINVNPAPTVSIEGPSALCGATSVTLTANASADAAYYEWYKDADPNPIAEGASASSLEVSAEGEYKVRVRNSNNCYSVLETHTLTSEGNEPIPTITPAGEVTACGELTLVASDGDSYLWSNGETTKSITVQTSGNYWVEVTYNGCPNPTPKRSEEVVVTINPLPEAEITPSGPTTFCQGESVELTASPGDSYLWSTGETSQSITVTSSGEYSVTVTVSGCSSSSTMVPVTVTDPPVSTITATDPTSFCEGESITLTANEANANEGDLYRWSNGETGQSITVSPTTSQEYTVEVSYASGCVSTSAPFAVTVYPKPDPSFSGIADGAVIYSGDPDITLSGSHANGTFAGPGISGNIFSPCNALAEGETEAEVAISYTVTDDNECSNTVTKFITVRKSVYVAVVTSSIKPFCRGDNVTHTVQVYRDPSSVVYPYLVNSNGQPIREDGSLVGPQELPVANPAYPFPAETPEVIKANAYRYFDPIVTGGTALDPGLFTYQWTKNQEVETGADGYQYSNAGLSSLQYYSVFVSTTANALCGTVWDRHMATRAYTGEQNGYSIDLNVSPNPICVGDAVTLTASLNAEFGFWDISNLQLDWTLTRGNTSTTLGTTYYNAADNSGLEFTTTGPEGGFIDGDKVSIVFSSDADAMDSPGNQCAKSNASPIITINVHQPASITTDLPASAEKCVGDEHTFSVNATGTDLQFSWHKGDGTPLSNLEGKISIENTETTSSLTIYTLTEEDAGTYYLVVTNGGASVCSATQQSVTATLTIHPVPAVSVADLRTCEGTPVTVAATASGGTSPYTYTWTVPEGVTNPGNVSSFETTVGGTYTVSLTDENTCTSAQAACVVTVEAVTLVSEAALEVTWINEATQWEVKAVEEVEGEFGENPVFTWFKRVFPSEDWGEPIQTGPDSIYIENAPHEDLEFKVELMNSETCTRYELTNIGVTSQPVEMIYFKATQQETNVLLQWATATEKFNAGFEVQVSTDGRHYRKLAFVETRNGNSLEIQEYSFADKEPATQELRYYRLKQLDVDGTTAFYGPVSLVLKHAGKVAVYPNPFHDQLQLHMNAEREGGGLLMVTNTLGTVLLRQGFSLEKGLNSKEILLNPALPAGIYLFTIQISGKVQHFKLLKE